MDNHPIPQDITGFQFKLIGNMTIRQFAYLAIGGVLAWLFFFVIDFPTIIKWPLSILSISAGAIFAFVPIDGRPMDQMLSNFIRAIISPTQFIYEKEGMKVEESSLPKSQPLQLPHLHMPHHDTPAPQLQSQPATQPNYAQMQVTMPIPQPVQAPIQPAPAPQMREPQPEPPKEEPSQVIPPPPPPMPTNVGPITASMTMEAIADPDEIRKKNRELDSLKDDNKKLAEELEKLKKELEEAKKAQEEALKATPLPAPMPIPAVQAVPELTQEQKDLQRQLIEAEREKVALQQQILEQQAKAQAPTQGVTPMPSQAPVSSQRVRSIQPGMEKAAGIPSIPEAPNLITGIVKDPRGNPLQSILIEVKDQDSNPVRAFKTNGLGKFASATSLSNGKYLITFEDPKETNKFDAVEIELVGAPVMPLEIISVDPREELRRELFK